MWEMLSCRRWGVRCLGNRTLLCQQILLKEDAEVTKSYIADFTGIRICEPLYILQL